MQIAMAKQLIEAKVAEAALGPGGGYGKGKGGGGYGPPMGYGGGPAPAVAGRDAWRHGALGQPSPRLAD